MSGQYHSPEKVYEELNRRGYTCGLFFDDYQFTLLKAFQDETGCEAKKFSERVEADPEQLVGVYPPDCDYEALADAMAFVKYGRKAA